MFIYILYAMVNIYIHIYDIICEVQMYDTYSYFFSYISVYILKSDR